GGGGEGEGGGREAEVEIHGRRVSRGRAGKRLHPAARRAYLRAAAGAISARPPRQRMAMSTLATPSSPVTAGTAPSRIALTNAASSARSGSAWPTQRGRIE